MQHEPGHLFSVDGDTLVPTELVRGPWDHGLQHGGAVAGALGWIAKSCIERSGEGEAFRLCRQTTEIMRPVPVAPLRFTCTLDHRGRRSRVLTAGLWHDGRLVARASSQWATGRADASTKDRQEHEGGFQDLAVPIRPVHAADPGDSDFNYPRPGFNCDVFELRPVAGTTEDPGPGSSWVRMKTALIAGQPLDPVQFLATLADLGNAVGWDYSPAGLPMVNPDLTLQVMRYPKGEWVCLESSSVTTGAGIGMMDTTLWDGDGRIGRVLSTTMESTMPLSAAPPNE